LKNIQGNAASQIRNRGSRKIGSAAIDRRAKRSNRLDSDGGMISAARSANSCLAARGKSMSVYVDKMQAVPK
jgi:hypothetical protein